MKVIKSEDGTSKVEFAEGYSSVIIPSKNGKHTICLSSQIGCPLQCSFCRTGQFKRDLAVEEMIRQVRACSRIIKDKPSSIVFMGSGEPMLNFDDVSDSIVEINKRFGIPYDRITLSTCGIDLSLLLDVPYNIAISLHTPFEAVRRRLMPRAAPIEDVLLFAEEYSYNRKHGVMIEYLLIKDINDSNSDIDALLSLDWPSNVNFNIIEFNEHKGFKRSDRLVHFKEALRQAGYKCFIRQSRGRDIGAACGMLS